MTKRLYALLLLAALTAASVSSCGDNSSAQPTSDTQSPAGSDAPTEAAETEAYFSNVLPAGLDLGGRTIRIMSDYNSEGDAFTLNAKEATGDIVNDAVYNRNLEVQSALNVTLTCDDYYIGATDAASTIGKSVQAGSDDYDIVFGLQWDIVPLVLDNIFMNIADAKYLDIEQPWWYQDYIRELSVGKDKMYFVTGDITLGVLRNMSCMYVNKSLYAQYYESADEIYQEVLDGKWTLDALAERCAEVYQDLNGDGKMDENDRFGIAVNRANLTDHFTYDAGVRATARDADNIPYITMNNEKTATFTQKLYDLYYNNRGTYVLPDMPGSDDTDVIMPNMLNADGLLYMPGWFYTSEVLRNKEVSYAVIPFPKFDENQETYLSLAHDVATVVCVPTTAKGLDDISAVMEALAYGGYRDILPAYYEVAIKIKYSRDSTDTAMRVLDIIHDNSTTDFAYIYNYAMNNLGLIERDLMTKKQANFSSLYSKSEKGYQKNLDKLIATFTEIDN